MLACMYTACVSEQVRYWTETGASGFLVYRYELRRRPGQGQLCSKALVFGGGCAPKNFTAESRKKEVRRPTPLYFAHVASFRVWRGKLRQCSMLQSSPTQGGTASPQALALIAFYI